MRHTNLIVLSGNLTRDPEVKFTPSGTAIAKIGMASSESWKDKATGEWRDKTVFVDVDIFGPTAEYAGKNCYKGQHVQVIGKLKLDTWEDKNTGAKRSKVGVECRELQLLQRREGNDGEQPQDSTPPQQQGGSQSSDDDVHW